MANSFSEILGQLKKTLGSKASGKDILQLVEKIKIPAVFSLKDFTDFYDLILHVLKYLEKRLSNRNSDSEIIQARNLLINLVIKETLYKRDTPWEIQDVEAYFVSFFWYIYESSFSFESLISQRLTMEWNIFLKGYLVVQKVLETYLQKLEQKHKKPQGYVQNLKKALELNVQFEEIEAENVDTVKRWKEFVALLDYKNALVRAHAAKNLGAIYSIHRNIIFNGKISFGAKIIEDLPDFLNMLNIIGDKEKKAAGVLGAFINGYDQDLGIGALDYYNEVEKTNFNVKDFILDVLVQSPSEPYFPNIQPLEFYAHEYFDSDIESLKKLLKAGKEEIVLEALACGSTKLEGRIALLKQLSSSSSYIISERAREILKEN